MTNDPIIPLHQDSLRHSLGGSDHSDTSAGNELLAASNPNSRNSNQRKLLIGLTIALFTLGTLVYAGVGGGWLKTDVTPPDPCGVEPTTNECFAQKNSKGECELKDNFCHDGYTYRVGLYGGECGCGCYPVDSSPPPSSPPTPSVSNLPFSQSLQCAPDPATAISSFSLTGAKIDNATVKTFVIFYDRNGRKISSDNDNFPPSGAIKVEVLATADCNIACTCSADIKPENTGKCKDPALTVDPASCKPSTALYGGLTETVTAIGNAPFSYSFLTYASDLATAKDVAIKKLPDSCSLNEVISCATSSTKGLQYCKDHVPASTTAEATCKNP